MKQDDTKYRTKTSHDNLRNPSLDGRRVEQFGMISPIDGGISSPREPNPGCSDLLGCHVIGVSVA